MAKISLLIPVYNVEKYLRDCMECVINQTESNIEIICVEDCSTDASMEILKEYQEKDSRIKIISHKQNMGLCKARKDAVAEASGEYIMFLDSDDYLEKDACEELYQSIGNLQVDVLQFGTYLEYVDNVSEDMASWVENFMMPSEDKIEKEKLLRSCFIDGKINCNLVNKIWKTECCKKAYENIDDGHYVSGEDRYASFLLLYFAESAAGIKNKYYHYRLGVGVTGGEVLDMERFEKRCQGSIITKKIGEFLHKEGKEKKFQEEYEAFGNDILWDCVDCWYNKLPKNEKKYGYHILLKNWKPWEITGALARVYFEKQAELVKSVGIEGEKVAVYYRYAGYTKMNDVIKKYIEMSKEVDESVLLLTDEDAPYTGEQYLECDIKYLPAATTSNWDKYKIRSERIYDIICDEKIKKIYYLSPTSHVAYLDKLLMESMGVNCQICMDEYVVDCRTKDIERKRLELEEIKKELEQKETELEMVRQKYDVTLNGMCHRGVAKMKQMINRFGGV